MIKLKNPPVDRDGRPLYLIGAYEMRLNRDGSTEYYEFDPVRRIFVPARKQARIGKSKTAKRPSVSKA